MLRLQGKALCVAASCAYVSTMSLRFRPLSGVVLWSNDATLLYAGMLRLFATGCGAAMGFAPLVSGGQRGAGRATKVCAQASSGNHIVARSATGW